MYDELFEAWKAEKENVGIQPLPKGLYARLAEYVKKVREERRMLDEKTVKGRLLLKEGENVRSMAEVLIRTRYEKMMSLITREEVIPTTTLAEEEESIYRDGVSQADAFQAFMKNLLQGRVPKESKARPKGAIVVRILQEMPEIIGADMRTYGPFKPEDIAALPKQNARTLIKQGAAVEVETQQASSFS